MSGRPVRHRLLADVDQSGGWAAVLKRIASGETITQIARSFNVSRGFFSRLLHEDRGRHEVALRVREAVADARAEAALEIVDGAELTPGKKQASVGSRIGQLHPEALRRRAAAAHPHLPLALNRAAPLAEAGLADEPTSREGRGMGGGTP